MHALKRYLRPVARLSPAVIILISVGCVSPEKQPVRIIIDERERPTNNDNDMRPLRLGAGDRLGHALYEQYRNSTRHAE